MNQNWRGVIAAALLAISSAAPAGPVYYTNRATFNAANPGLPIEDFEKTNVAPDDQNACPGPLNSTTGPGGGCWDVGDVIPGFSIQDRPGPDASGIEMVGPGGFIGISSRAPFANSMSDSLDLFLGSGVSSVGLDLFSIFLASDVTISLFDGADALIDTQVVAASAAGTFWGVQDLTTPIVRINFNSVTGRAEGIDNLAFGNAVPEPATLALLGLGLAGLGFSRRKQ